MTSYSSAALGDVVRRLRLGRGLTQEQLGNQAGYGRGAAVSISRLEHGLVRPSPAKLSGIATALGLTPAALEQQASQAPPATGSAAPRPGDVPGPDAARGGKGLRTSKELKARASRIQAEVDERTRVLTSLGNEFNEQGDRAAEEFFMPFVRIVQMIPGAPQPGPTGVVPQTAAGNVGVGALWAASAALHQAVEESAGRIAQPRVPPGSDTFGTFVGATSRGVAPAGAAPGAPGPTPSDAEPAAPGRIGLATGGARIALGTAMLTGILAAPTMLLAAGGLVWMTRRSRRQQAELAANLDAAEAELHATAGGFETLATVLPRATAILDYIATHAGHALARWPVASNRHPVAWDALDAHDRQCFGEFSDVTAAHLSIVSIDFQGLLTAPGVDQHVLVANCGHLLDRARDIVTARV